MKKVFLVLAVLFLASPTWATVDVNVICVADSNEVTVRFDNTEPNHVRGFGLDITVDNGAKITAVTSFVADYNIYPGSIDINGQTGDVDANGSPIGDAVKYPNVTQPGIGFGGVTVEMGALYEGGPASVNAPADDDILFKVYVDKDCNVTIADNVARGGIVMENPQASSNDNLPQSCQVVLAGVCYTGPDVTEWANVGSPATWCSPKQCHGDATNSTESFDRNPVTVGMADVQLLLTGYNETGYVNPATHPWIAADFDHASESFDRQPVRVGMADVQVLLYYYNDLDNTVPADCQTSSPVSP